MIILILSFFTLCYLYIDFWLWRGLKQRVYLRSPIIPLKNTEAKNLPNVTLMVSARNESEQIEACVRSLIQQEYPTDKIQILITDDRSEDDTLKILRELQSFDSRIEILESPELIPGESPKKNALTHMIQKARGEILMTTDADCIVPATWVWSTVQAFQTENNDANNVHMVVGFSQFKEDPAIPSWFFKLQALEFLSHFVVSAGALAQKFAINSSGNNLAYRRQSFLDLGGFKGLENIISGDDDLLLHRFQQRWPGGIVFNDQSDSYATTEAQPTITALWNQRKRWASKTVFYTPQVVLLLSTVFFFYFTTALALLSILWGDLQLFKLGVLAFVVKTLADFFVLQKGAQLFKKEHLLAWFWPTAVFHIPLILGAVLFGIFGKFNWKGRETGNLGNSNSVS